MKARLLMFALGMLMLARAFAQSNEAPVRLALLAETPEAGTAVDLLTAELSAKPGLVLLERNEIEKIYREQGLSAANQDRLKLGRILGADGLLILGTVSEGTNQFLTARLIAVKPGVVVGNARFAWPVPDTTQWARWITARFEPLFPKLGVLVKDAVPISVVNFRSAIRSVDSQEGERQLTALAIERLTQERRLFVLERRRMELMSEENELKGGDESNFWDGSYLLDGVIDRDGYAQETMTINARLMPPKGGAPVSFELKGSRTNLAGLVNQLADKVTGKLNLATSAAWNPEDEANEYFEEAKWAFKWNMLKEAQAACEASWSLGKNTREVAELRVRAYHAEAVAAWPDWAFLAPTPENSAPVAAKLEIALTALRYYQSAFQMFPASETKPDIAWYVLGVTLLNADSELLQRFYYYGRESASYHKEDLAELRALVRNTAGMIDGRQYQGVLKPAEDKFFIHTRNERGSDTYLVPWDVETLKAADGALWCDTPEQCLEMHREFVRSGAFDRLYKYMAYQEIIAWNPEDQGQIPGLWREFIQEVCASTNALTKVGGYYLAFADAKPDQEYRDRALQFFQVVADNAFAIVSAKRTGSMVQDIEDLLANPPGGTPEETIWRGVHQYYYTNFERDFNFGAILGYLEKDTRFDANQMVDYLNPAGSRQPFKPEQAGKLASALENYKARLLQKQGGKPFRYDYHNYDFVANEVKAALPQSVVAANTPSNLANTATSAVAAAPARASPPFLRNWPGSVEAVRLHGDSTNLLHVARFWNFPPGWIDDDYDNFPAINIGERIFREGRFWLEVYNPSIQTGLHKAFIYGVDLNSFQTEVIELPLDKTVLDVGGEQQELFSTGNSFEVLGDSVYFGTTGGVQRYSLSTKKWEKLDMPMSGAPAVVNGRLFIISADNIAEINKDGKGATVLASARRRPAENLLDALGNFGNIFPGPNGALRTLVGGKIYTRSRAENDWSETVALPEKMTLRSSAVFDGGIMAVCSSSESDTEWLWLPEDQSSFDALLLEPKTFQNQYRSPNAPDRTIQPKPGEAPEFRWKHPQDLALYSAPMAMESGNLYLFSGNLNLESKDSGPGKLVEQGGRHTLLVVFKKDTPEACMVPLWFELKDGVFSPRQLNKLLGMNRSTPEGLMHLHATGAVVFHTTPQGLVVSAEHIPGFWLIPWSDANPRIETIAAEHRAEQETQALALEKEWSDLLKKYHLDHRDNFTPAEKEAMIDDPDFLKLELPRIDLNQNEQLDPDELAFFDANQNGSLDAREMSGIQRTWALLAARLMDELDRNGDSVLDSSELPRPDRTDARTSFIFPNNWLMTRLSRPGANGATLADLEALQQSTTESVLMQGRLSMSPKPPPNFAQLDESQKRQAIQDMMIKRMQPEFKDLVEEYWKGQQAAGSTLPGTSNPAK